MARSTLGESDTLMGGAGVSGSVAVWGSSGAFGGGSLGGDGRL
jgi:hypothetical protein